MSGGHFDYAQYRIEEIAESIEREIERAIASRPPKVYETIVSVTREETFDSCTRCSYIKNPYKSLEEARRYYTRGYKLLEETDKEILVQDEVTGDVYRIKEVEIWDYEDGGFYPDYTPETLQEFRSAIHQLRKAAIYAQRVDWLISGDDGEDTFHKRLKEDLEKLPKIEDMV